MQEERMKMSSKSLCSMNVLLILETLYCQTISLTIMSSVMLQF